ncbi:MAG: hypothetical protein ABFD29_06190 [Anaerolineaceae bacterium]
MMKTNWRIIVGALLILVGVLAVLQNFGIFTAAGIIWGNLLLAAGAVFIWYLMSNQAAWWAILPGGVLASTGLVIIISELFPGISEIIGGLIILGGIGISFWIVYLMNHDFWWAIIPAGVMSSLAVVTVIEALTHIDGGFVFLFGLAATFALLTILPGLPGDKHWPRIPALVLFILSIVTLATEVSWGNYVWAIILIAAGGFMILRSVNQPH